MASRTLSRRALREQNDKVETDEVESDAETPDIDDDAPAEPRAKKPRTRKTPLKDPAAKKAPAKPRARKKSVKAASRMVARWAVCDGALKRLELFEYKDRAGADAKMVQMYEHKKGPFYIQLVKEPYNPPENDPVTSA
jgi:cell division septation protein DedD